MAYKPWLFHNKLHRFAASSIWQNDLFLDFYRRFPRGNAYRFVDFFQKADVVPPR